MKKGLFIALVMIAGIGCTPKLSADHDWGNQRWTLIELKGVPVQLSGSRRDAYIEFLTREKRFSGNGGCNSTNGAYILDKKSSIHFTDVISTKMSCPDIAFENTFLATLNKVNRYEINGSTLLLKDGNEILLILERK